MSPNKGSGGNRFGSGNPRNRNRLSGEKKVWKAVKKGETAKHPLKGIYERKGPIFSKAFCNSVRLKNSKLGKLSKEGEGVNTKWHLSLGDEFIDRKPLVAKGMEILFGDKISKTEVNIIDKNAVIKTAEQLKKEVAKLTGYTFRDMNVLGGSPHLGSDATALLKMVKINGIPAVKIDRLAVPSLKIIKNAKEKPTEGANLTYYLIKPKSNRVEHIKMVYHKLINSVYAKFKSKANFCVVNATSQNQANFLQTAFGFKAVRKIRKGKKPYFECTLDFRQYKPSARHF